MLNEHEKHPLRGAPHMAEREGFEPDGFHPVNSAKHPRMAAITKEIPTRQSFHL